MLLRNLYKGGLLAVATLGIMTSCNDIPENERFIEVEPVVTKRVTLIQEFTGMWCTNCPQGARIVHEIQETYPGAVIAVNMHPENTSFTRPLDGLSLTCPEATVMYNYYKPVGFPAAIIDGVGPNSSLAQWAEMTESAVAVPTKVEISSSTDYNATSRELTVNYEVGFTDDYAGDLSVMVWVMENGIKGSQIDGGRPDKNYIHNHVLRASVNGEWGQQLGASFEMNQKIKGTASMTLDKNWIAENCEVVTYVFRTGDKYVEQATVTDAISK
ncbi:MAG: Omp28 family outer membrane lipoprotein [Muribaculaceae bacterium]|nr:Omp28 family outer membrane lipoprotein [Muribaculaceae bacterium]